MKKWLREWALVDLFALGLGLLLTIGYIIGYWRIPSDSPQSNLIPNIATEIVGVWLSVRIIDRIISARETFHSARRRLLSDFEVIADTLQAFFPGLAQWQIASVESWISWIEEQRASRSKHLYPDEITAMDECIKMIRQLITQCNEYVQRREQSSQAKLDLDQAFITIREPRERIHFELQRFKYAVSEKAIAEPLPANSVASGFEQLTKLEENCLTPEEKSDLRTLVEEIKDLEVVDYEASVAMWTDVNWSNIASSIYKGNLGWYFSIDQACDLIEGQPIVNMERYKDLLDTAQDELAQSHETLPPSIVEAAKGWLDSVQNLPPVAVDIYELRRRFTDLRLVLKRNILVESPYE